MHNSEEAVAFMQRFSFATLTTVVNGEPVATHLPILTEIVNGKVVLASHMAKANIQAAALESGTHLVVFAEPHAYVSPGLYDRKNSVPTWDYMAVHVYGTAVLKQGENAIVTVLEKTINFYESAYMQQWQTLPDTYKNALFNELVAFEIQVTRLEGKKKLSQDRPQTERNRIADAFAQSDNASENTLAEYMKKEF